MLVPIFKTNLIEISSKTFSRYSLNEYRPTADHFIYPLWPNVPFLHPLKTSENRRFTDVFTGCRNGTFVKKIVISRFHATLYHKVLSRMFPA